MELMQQEFGTPVRRAESGEILDDMVTRSRGEVKRVNSPKITSSGGTPVSELRNRNSPRLSEKAYSPRISELRQDRSPIVGGLSPRTGEIRPSKLGGDNTSKK